MRILLIEDDDTIASLEKQIFSEHDVTHVKNIHDAVTEKMSLAIGKCGAIFDLVVLDLVLPRQSVPGTFHRPKDVLRITNESLKGLPIVVVSAFLDEDLTAVIGTYGMVYIDKTLLENTDAFRLTFFGLAEVSRKMRSAALTQHLTIDAVKTANKNTEKPQPVASVRERTEARLYLLAGATVIMLPWVLIGWAMYSRAVLHDSNPLPYYTETLAFCALAIACILGIAPYLMRFFGKGDGK